MKGNKNSPLVVAMRENHLDIALYLFDHGCGSDEDKHKALSQACKNGELKIVKELVELDNVNPKGETSCYTESDHTVIHLYASVSPLCVNNGCTCTNT